MDSPTQPSTKMEINYISPQLLPINFNDDLKGFGLIS